jgi:hypothetical protein
MAVTAYRPDLGRVGGEMAEALAWLHSPAMIAGEIARLETAQREGDRSEATGVQLADWRAVQRAQAKLVGGDKQGALPWS